MSADRPNRTTRAPSPRLMWACCGVVSLLALTAGGAAWAQAKTREGVQVQRLTTATAHAATIRQAEAALPAWTRLPRGGALAQEVGATIASVGLPASALASLSAESETGPGAGSSSGSSAATVQARSRRATVVLTGVTLPQVGEFLSKWRVRQPAWTVAGIELAPEAGAATAKAQTGGDLPLRAVLSLETLSLDRPAAPSPARAGGAR